MSSIGKNLFSSKKITNISLYNLSIDKKVSENISQGISKNKSLQNLSIKNCKIPIDSYEILLKGLFSHDGIKYIDLSNNNFSDKYGNMISRIILRQAQRRDQIIWSYGLRNEFPDTNEFTKGLISINLHGNKLGDESTEFICSSLCSDQYIRAIDLSDNFINNDSCKKYIYMMRKNNTLLTIDLRNNPGYDENIHSRLVMKMSKNIHFLYQQYQSGGYTDEEFENLKDYIEISFFDVDIPQEIVEFYNENLPEEEENCEEDEENVESGNNDIQAKEIIGNNNNEKVILSNISTNLSKNNILNKSVADKSLIEENLKLKQQIIELKALNLQKHLKGNMNDNSKENRTIEGDYKRVLELINELNDVMNDIENKKNKKIKIKDNKENINNKNIINKIDKDNGNERLNISQKQEKEKENK